TAVPSISQAKRDKSFRFFERRSAWLSDFRDDSRVTTRLCFAFVVRQCAMQVDEEAVQIDHDGNESFRLLFVPLATINEQLDRAVDSPSAAASSSSAAALPHSPPKLALGSAASNPSAC